MIVNETEHWIETRMYGKYGFIFYMMVSFLIYAMFPVIPLCIIQIFILFLFFFTYEFENYNDDLHHSETNKIHRVLK